MPCTSVTLPMRPSSVSVSATANFSARDRFVVGEDGQRRRGARSCRPLVWTARGCDEAAACRHRRALRAQSQSLPAVTTGAVHAGIVAVHLTGRLGPPRSCRIRRRQARRAGPGQVDGRSGRSGVASPADAWFAFSSTDQCALADQVVAAVGSSQRSRSGPACAQNSPCWSHRVSRAWNVWRRRPVRATSPRTRLRRSGRSQKDRPTPTASDGGRGRPSQRAGRQ